MIKEIETPAELEGYKRLTEFHYRGAGGAGRRVPLIAVTNVWELPEVVGFIEITSTFLVNTARKTLLDAPFSDPHRGVAWARWTSVTARRFSNSVARISRCVVFPELRGLGLSRLLVDAAVAYARDRWHIGGLQPSFIEITAEMLRYWPFVKGAGFTYIGDTEGNQHRAAKDMRYLLRRKLGAHGLPQGGGGILSAQRAYATTLAGIIEDSDLSVEKIVSLLHQSPDKLSDEEWVQLHSVFRRPKPTFIRGLTPAAESLLKRRIPRAACHPKSTVKCSVLELAGLSIETEARPVRTAAARRVQEAFGIVTTKFHTRIADGFHLSVRSGDRVLIDGPSGSGKSLLLKGIEVLATGAGQMPDGVTLRGERSSKPLRVTSLQKYDVEQSPIELFHSYPLDSALATLASAGLAEPQLFVREAKRLSAGQAYRLALALAMAPQPEVMIVDEFCEALDRYTAVAVSHRLRQMTQRSGTIVIVGTADSSRIIGPFDPTVLVHLASDGRVRVETVSPHDTDAANKESTVGDRVQNR
jgi:ABC-type lipoprotein export system ATPase subunit/GNAT superfamily N-acetyltransferase